jgi:hypothetical protein
MVCSIRAGVHAGLEMKERPFLVHSAGAQGTHEGSSEFVAWLTKEALFKN